LNNDALVPTTVAMLMHKFPVRMR